MLAALILQGGEAAHGDEPCGKAEQDEEEETHLRGGGSVEVLMRRRNKALKRRQGARLRGGAAIRVNHLAG